MEQYHNLGLFSTISNQPTNRHAHSLPKKKQKLEISSELKKKTSKREPCKMFDFFLCSLTQNLAVIFFACFSHFPVIPLQTRIKLQLYDITD